jgi:small subunit ribosomal protein S2
MPDALYLADMRVDKTALNEAIRKDVPVVAVSDSNTNPEKVAYAIPANDDAVNSIKMIADLIAEAVKEGKMELEKKQAEAPVVKKPEIVKKERKAQRKEESL